VIYYYNIILYIISLWVLAKQTEHWKVTELFVATLYKLLKLYILYIKLYKFIFIFIFIFQYNIKTSEHEGNQGIPKLWGFSASLYIAHHTVLCAVSGITSVYGHERENNLEGNAQCQNRDGRY